MGCEQLKLKQMKRILISCMLLLGIHSVDAQVAKVALSHKGNLTMYNAENLSDALNDALDGDTIFLNEGTFQGGITISKAITLIGAGQNTIINGNITVSYSGTLKARLLDALNISGSVSISSTLNGLTIRKCSFTRFGTSDGVSLSNAIFDRCYVIGDRFYINTIMKNVRIVNSVIQYPYGYASNVGDVTFSNCNIGYFNYSNNVKATFINCIVKIDKTQKDSFFSYCCLSADNGTNTMQNCKIGSFSWSNTYQYTPDMTGTDGTVVGINGGTTPFTLVPSNPKVNKYSLNVDTQNKKLTVNISVSAN